MSAREAAGLGGAQHGVPLLLHNLQRAAQAELTDCTITGCEEGVTVQGEGAHASMRSCAVLAQVGPQGDVTVAQRL